MTSAAEPQPAETNAHAAVREALDARPGIKAADDEALFDAVNWALSVIGHNHQPLIDERLSRAGGHVPAIARRLLDVEAELQRTRAARDEEAQLMMLMARAMAVDKTELRA